MFLLGLYSYLDDLGERHSVRYAAGAGTGYQVTNAVPDAPSLVKYSAPLYKTSLPARGKVSYERGPGGQYKFIASAPDQRRSESTGADGITRGSYSYLDDKGLQRTVEYIAGAGIGYKIVQSSTGPGTHLSPRPAIPQFSASSTSTANDISDADGTGFKKGGDSPAAYYPRRPAAGGSGSLGGSGGSGGISGGFGSGESGLGSSGSGSSSGFDRPTGGSGSVNRGSSPVNRGSSSVNRGSASSGKNWDKNPITGGSSGGIRGGSSSNVNGFGSSESQRGSADGGFGGGSSESHRGGANRYGGSGGNGDKGSSETAGFGGSSSGPNRYGSSAVGSGGSGGSSESYGSGSRGSGSGGSGSNEYGSGERDHLHSSGGHAQTKPSGNRGGSGAGFSRPSARPTSSGSRGSSGGSYGGSSGGGSGPPYVTSNEASLAIDRNRDWTSAGRDSTIVKNVGKWYVGLPPGSAVRAHVQNIDLLPIGGRPPSPSEALRKDVQRSRHFGNYDD